MTSPGRGATPIRLTQSPDEENSTVEHGARSAQFKAGFFTLTAGKEIAPQRGGGASEPESNFATAFATELLA
jgi:hypothetical protein